MKSISILVGYLLLTIASAAAQSPSPVFAPPTGALSIHQAEEQGTLYGKAVGSTAWHVSQWGNPSGDISDFSDGVAKNASLSVAVNGGAAPGITIAQSGQKLACDKDGAPREFDGFVGTDSRNENRGTATESASTTGESLAKYQALMQQIDLQLVSAKIAANANECKDSKAVSMVSLVFNNNKIRSTLFFQIILYAFNAHPHDVWWAHGQRPGRFGYNLVAPMANTAWSVGEHRQFQMDLLPTISRLIKNNTVGMDADLADWFIAGAYFGNAIYGHVDIATTWRGYRLERR